MTAGMGFAFEVFFDGDCPLCRREVAFLRRLDLRRNAIRFTDIATAEFDPQAHGVERTLEELMARIHGRAADGELVEGVEVFRRLYAAVGFGPLVALSRLRPFAYLLDAGYRWFAKNRLRLTGRCDDGACLLREGGGSRTLPTASCATSSSTASPTSSRASPLAG